MGVARVTFRAVRTLSPFGRMRDGRVVARSPPGLGLTVFDPLEGLAVGVAMKLGVPRVTFRAFLPLIRITDFGRVLSIK